MRNFISDGKVIDLTVDEDVASGEGVVIGSIFGVATRAALSGETVPCIRSGEVELTKVAGAIAQGDKIYFNDTSDTVTKTSATGLFLIGAASLAAQAGDATVRVLLDGVAVTAAP